MSGAKKLIGVCLSQAHTFLKTDFLVELDNQARKEGYSIVVFNSSMDYYWAQKGSNVTGGNLRLALDSDKTPVSPAGLPLCFANPGKDHYEAVFSDQEEEWTYHADRNKEGYLGVWILL